MNDIDIKQYIESILEQRERVLDEREKRWVELRKADHKSLDEYKDETQRALAIAKSSADRFMTTLLSLVAIIISIATAAFVYVKH